MFRNGLGVVDASAGCSALFLPSRKLAGVSEALHLFFQQNTTKPAIFSGIGFDINHESLIDCLLNSGNRLPDVRNSYFVD